MEGRTKAIAASVAVIGASIATTTVDAQPAAAVGGVTTWQHNICGAVGCNWLGNLVTTAPLKSGYAQNTGDTLAMGTQETCASQYADMKNFFDNYASYWISGTHLNEVQTSGCGSGSPVFYGVTAFARAYDTNNRVSEDSFSPAVQDGGEDRGYVCVIGGTARWYMSCSAHMKNGLGVPQTSEYGNVIDFGALAYSMYWGGDLYVDTGEWPYNVSANHLEADYCSGGLHPTTNTKKWDWAFAGFRPVNCAADATLYPEYGSNPPLCFKNPGCGSGQFSSDHRIIGGHQTH